MNMSEKITAKHAGSLPIHAGQLGVTCRLDMVLSITAPPPRFLRESGAYSTMQKCIVPDHFQPSKDVKEPSSQKIVREFCARTIVHYYEQEHHRAHHPAGERGVCLSGHADDLKLARLHVRCGDGFSTGGWLDGHWRSRNDRRSWFKIPGHQRSR